MAEVSYSVNLVGFVKRMAPPGLSMFANQLNGTPDNRIRNIIGEPPGTITISKFNPVTGNFSLALFDPDVGWSDPTDMFLNPGEGAFIDNASGGPLPLLFVGEVQLHSTLTIHAGLDVYSVPLPAAGSLDLMGFPVQVCNLSIYKFNGHDFDVFVYDNDAGGWSPAVPSVDVGDSFFVDSPGQCVRPWTVDYVIGP